MTYVDLNNFGYWLNAASFIIAFTFIAYTVYNISADATSNEAGALIALIILIPIFFVGFNFLIRLKSPSLTSNQSKNLAFE
jgi:hypothetical protein